MRLARLVVLPAILAASFLLASASKVPAEDTENIRVRFEIFGLAGLHVLTNRTIIEKAADRYSITMDLDTRGLARVFVDLTSHSEVRGRLARDAARPDAYRVEVLRNGVDHSYGVDYRTDGTVINASTPSSPGWASSIPAAQIRGTVDQLTAYFLLERQLPSRPGELHPEPLTDPDLILSHHPARAIARRLPPFPSNIGFLPLPVDPKRWR